MCQVDYESSKANTLHVQCTSTVSEKTLHVSSAVTAASQQSAESAAARGQVSVDSAGTKRAGEIVLFVPMRKTLAPAQRKNTKKMNKTPSETKRAT